MEAQTCAEMSLGIECLGERGGGVKGAHAITEITAAALGGLTQNTHIPPMAAVGKHQAEVAACCLDCITCLLHGGKKNLLYLNKQVE